MEKVFDSGPFAFMPPGANPYSHDFYSSGMKLREGIEVMTAEVVPDHDEAGKIVRRGFRLRVIDCRSGKAHEFVFMVPVD